MISKHSLIFTLLFLCYAIFTDGHNNPETAFKFVENKGQWESQILFKSDIPGGALFLENNKVTYHLVEGTAHKHGGNSVIDSIINHHGLQLIFRNSYGPSAIEKTKPTKEYYNFFLGNDPGKWASNVKAYEQILYKEIYKNTDIVFYTSQKALKYDVIVKKGGDPAFIDFEYSGANNISLNEGTLVVSTSLGNIIEGKPYAYQMIDGRRVQVICNFQLQGNRFGFQFPDGYDKNYDLIIDPTLIFSTYSGSFADNFGYTATFDSYGFLYSGSSVFGVGYPTTVGAFDQTYNGVTGTDIAISKFDTTGTFLIYSTYLGGSSVELPHSMIVNGSNELLLMGTTSSSDFPVTTQCFDSVFSGGTPIDLTNGLGVNYNNGSDIIVCKFNSSGSALLASTFLGGTGNDGLNSFGNGIANAGPTRYNYADEVRGEIEIDARNNVFIISCTRSEDFPVTANVLQPVFGGGGLDACFVKLDPALSSATFSTYLGGAANEAAYSMAIDSTGNFFVTGGTNSPNFPTTDSTLFPSFQGGRTDGFVTHISSDGTTIISSSYIGSAFYDQIYFVELDRKNNVYVYGQTEDQNETFIFNALYNVPDGGQFITKMTHELDSVIWSTTFGKPNNMPTLSPTAFLVDLCNKIYLSGWGGSDNQFSFLNNNADPTIAGLPTTPDAFQSSTDGSDFYLMVLADDASSLVYGSFMGGPFSQEHVDGGTSRFDRKGKVYQAVCGGCGRHSDFPIKPNPGAVSATNNSFNCNLAVFKFDFHLPEVVADFVAPPVGCAPFTVNFQNTSLEQTQTGFFWNFGDNSTSIAKNPSHTYTKAGTYKVRLIVVDNVTCNLSDTLVKEILVLGDTAYSLPTSNICPGQTTQIGILPSGEQNVTYNWIPSTGLSNSHISNPNAFPNATTTYQLLISNGICTDTLSQQVAIRPLTINATGGQTICSNITGVLLNATGTGNPVKFIWSSNPNFTDTLNQNTSQSSYFATPISDSTYYYVKGINGYGCEGIDSAKIKISRINISAPDVYGCLNDTVPVQVQNLRGDPLRYFWSPSNRIISYSPDSSLVYVKAYPPFSLHLDAINGNNCLASDDINIAASSLPDKSLLSIFADKDTIYRTKSTGLHVRPLGYNYQWSPSGSLNKDNIADPVASPKNTTTYNVEVSDPLLSRCRVDTSITIYIKEIQCDEPYIYVPNAFTPDGDLKNDILYVRGVYIEELLFIIYDRWGEKMFETRDITKGWDGTFKDMLCDPAVYDYYLEVKCVDGEKFFKKGNFTLIR